MRVSTSSQGADWRLSVRLDPEEGLDALGQWDIPIQLTTDRASVRLPRPADPHPDLNALAVLMVVGPWVLRQLTLDAPVSQRMANAADDAFGIKLGPIDSQLPGRVAGPRAALAFSGGPDSMASDLLISEELTLHHFVRVKHPLVPNRATHFRPDVALARVLQIADQRAVSITRSDIEFVAARPFPTFSYWTSMGIGAVLLADEDDLGAIAFGRHIGGSYVHSGKRFDLLADHDVVLRTLFSGGGLDLVVPTAGLTEVGTMKLAREHPLIDLAISCQLGAGPAGCRRCEKCLRKELINAYLDGRPAAGPVIGWAAEDSGLRHRFEDFQTTPMPHIYAFLASRLEGLGHTFLDDWLRRLHDPYAATAWVERHYPRGLDDWIPIRWRRDAAEILDDRLGAMSPDEIEIVEAWPNPLVGSTSRPAHDRA